jgi:hypothetical protein
MKLFITEFPRPRIPIHATLILPFGFAAMIDGAVDAAATAAPVVLRKDRRVKVPVFMGVNVDAKSNRH